MNNSVYFNDVTINNGANYETDNAAISTWAINQTSASNDTLQLCNKSNNEKQVYSIWWTAINGHITIQLTTTTLCF